jgi:hypothetical protein
LPHIANDTDDLAQGRIEAERDADPFPKAVSRGEVNSRETLAHDYHGSGCERILRAEGAASDHWDSQGFKIVRPLAFRTKAPVSIALPGDRSRRLVDAA